MQSEFDFWTYDVAIKTLQSVSNEAATKDQIELRFTRYNQDSAWLNFQEGYFIGLRKTNKNELLYFYENGQLWIEKTYENGLLLNVNGSYTKDGNLRDKGTIKNGNGTVIHYTEEGKIYAILTFQNGLKVKNKSQSGFIKTA